MPLEPYTEDASYLEVFKETVEPLVAAFKPDIILSVHGVDIHYRDPLTHMNCTLNSLYSIPYIIQDLAKRYCNHKVLMFGAEVIIFGELSLELGVTSFKFNRGAYSTRLPTVKLD